MADAYITAVLESDLPLSRYITVTPGSGLLLQDGGPLQPINITTTGFLNAIAGAQSSQGYLVSNGSGGVLVRSFANSSTVTVNIANGVANQTSFNVVNSSSIQNVTVVTNSTSILTPRSTLNFIAGANVGVSAVDDGANNRTNITITATGQGTPVNATYWVAESDPILTDEVNIGALDTGLLVVSVTGGVATPATLEPALGNLAVGNGSQWVELAIGASGTVLASDGSSPVWLPEAGGAPASATYFTASANSTLTNEVNLGALTSGVLGLTVAASVATPVIVTQMYENTVRQNFFAATGAGNGASVTGTDNVAVGYDAAKNMTTGQANTIFGANACSIGILTGNFNVLIGNNAGQNCAAATDNIFIGNNAGLACTTGSESVGIGSGALQNNVAVSGCTALGYVAGYNLTGANVTLIGYRAGYNGPGNNSTAIGNLALTTAGNSATGNTAVGASAGTAISTGDDNTIVGSGTGALVSTGSTNTLVGVSAGAALTTTSGNTLVGNQSCVAATNLTNCTAIGIGSTIGNSLSNSSAIGANAIVSTANTMRLGGNGVFLVNGDTTGPTNMAALNLMPAQGRANIYMGQSTTPTANASGGTLWINSSNQLQFTNPIGTFSLLNTSILVNYRVFTSSTTYTPTAGTGYCVIELIGGGGGGGGCAAGGGAGGGGGGGYIKAIVPVSVLAGGTITIGIAGTGGAAGANNGIAGNNSQFTNASATVLMTAVGGSPGNGSASGTSLVLFPADGGDGGSGSRDGTIINTSNSIILSGGKGGVGFYFYNGFNASGFSGFGAGNALSPTTGNQITGGAGENAINFGCGGSGACSNSGDSFAGGNGATGVCIITEYITS